MSCKVFEPRPIGVDKPSLAGGTIANDQPPNSFFQGLSPPFPTCTWWIGYAAGAGDAFCAGPFPYETRLSPQGIKYGISTDRQFDGTSIKQMTQTDWCTGFLEHSGKPEHHRAVAWDAQSVTLQYFTGPKTLTTTMVPGSPYITLLYSDATPLFISEQGPIISFNERPIANSGKESLHGTKFRVTTRIGTYVIYSLSGPISLSASHEGRIIASSPFTGVIRVVKIDHSSHESTLDKYVSTYPTGVETSCLFSSDHHTAILRFTWSVVGNPNELLMMTWPHHRMKMVSPKFLPVQSLSYLTTKGYMYPAIGKVWDLKYDLPTISWHAPRPPDESCIPSIVEGLKYEIDQLDPANAPVPGDFYFWGGSIGAKARLALIAEHVGRHDLIPRVTDYIKASFSHWFNSSSPVQAAYETTWGGIINKAGSNNFWVDFGNGYYNDHHFHYGYFLEAAATIAKFDPAWLAEHRSYIDWFLRDVVNPSISSDPYFTFTRDLDVFAGHSWASGIRDGAGSRDQESVSEAVNGYYGSMLWAEITGRQDIVNYCRLLIAMEQHAAKVYWHVYPESDGAARDQPYPEKGVRKLITIGNVQDWQAGAWLFWGDQKVQIASIQILPVIPVNEYMYDAAWARNVLEYTSSELKDPAISDDWKSLIYCLYSQHDPQKAAELSSELMTWGNGNTYTNQLYFISTRPNPSRRPILHSTATNPIGRFLIQSCANGRFVRSSPGVPDLIASATSPESAEVFEFGFAPNSGTMKGMSTGMFVTADQSGAATLASSRAVALGWEMFMIRPKAGKKDEYWMKAGSNKKFVTVDAQGRLLNKGDSASGASTFRFVPPPESWTPPRAAQNDVPGVATAGVSEEQRLTELSRSNPTGKFVIQDATTGRYVGTSSAENTLRAWAKSQADAEIFILEAGSIRAASNNQLVTADVSGTAPLAATRTAALAWELFTIKPNTDAGDRMWTIQAGSNGKFVTIRQDGCLVNDAVARREGAVFRFMEPHPFLLAPNPQGTFKLQCLLTGKFVVSVSESNYALVASSPSAAEAAVFVLESVATNDSVASCGTLKLLATQQFVSADISGNTPLAANRPAALAWEYFTIRKTAPTDEDMYTIRAGSNGCYVTVAKDGVLVNDGQSATEGGPFRLVAA